MDAEIFLDLLPTASKAVVAALFAVCTHLVDWTSVVGKTNSPYAYPRGRFVSQQWDVNRVMVKYATKTHHLLV
jgi:hypothetical protein